MVCRWRLLSKKDSCYTARLKWAAATHPWCPNFQHSSLWHPSQNTTPILHFSWTRAISCSSGGSISAISLHFSHRSHALQEPLHNCSFFYSSKEQRGYAVSTGVVPLLCTWSMPMSDTELWVSRKRQTQVSYSWPSWYFVGLETKSAYNECNKGQHRRFSPYPLLSYRPCSTKAVLAWWKVAV